VSDFPRPPHCSPDGHRGSPGRTLENFFRILFEPNAAATELLISEITAKAPEVNINFLLSILIVISW
jgi:hypothetical protein